MEPEIVHLFANPYAAAVAVLVAAVETMPDAWVPAPVRRWIGWLCVLACGPVALLLGHGMPGSLLSGAVGLSGVWLLLEVVEARSRHRRATSHVVVHSLARAAYDAYHAARGDEIPGVVPLDVASPEIQRAWFAAVHAALVQANRIPDPDMRAADTGEPPPIHPPPPVKVQDDGDPPPLYPPPPVK